MKRILACDLDGVLYRFNDTYIDLIKIYTGKTLPPETADYPAVWDYEREAGITKEEQAMVWKHINGHGNYAFWRFLKPYDGAKEFVSQLPVHFDETHFITARPGKDAKRASEDALVMLGVENPSVIIAHDKLGHIMDIEATHFLDDRDKNFEDILVKQDWRQHFSLENLQLFMLDRPWNRNYSHPDVKRIYNVEDMFYGPRTI